MGEAVIVKIDLSRSPEEYLKQHLTNQSKATKERIAEVVREKVLIQKAKKSLNKKHEIFDEVFTELVDAGENGLSKEYVINKLIEAGSVKTSSGTTLKLKTAVKKSLPDKKLVVTKDKYSIL